MENKPDTGPRMPAHLARFRFQDWSDKVGREPESWGGRRLGIPWALFKARSLYAQSRLEWRRQQRHSNNDNEIAA